MAGPGGAPRVAEPLVRGARGRVERGGLVEVTARPGEVAEEGARHGASALLGRTVGGAERAEQRLGHVASAEAVGRDPGRQPSRGPGIGVGPFVVGGRDRAHPAAPRPRPGRHGCSRTRPAPRPARRPARPRPRPGHGQGAPPGRRGRSPAAARCRSRRWCRASPPTPGRVGRTTCAWRSRVACTSARLVELLGGVLAQTHQHREPGVAVEVLPGPADQALVQQRLDHVEDVGLGAHRGGARRGPTPRGRPTAAGRRRCRARRAGRGSRRWPPAGRGAARARPAVRWSARVIRRPSRNASSLGVNTRSRAAASSIASGSPSRPMQISASARAVFGVSWTAGGARSRSSATAGLPRRRARSSASSAEGMGRGGTAYSRSAASRSRSRLVASTCSRVVERSSSAS